jgi:branched-chain amino acid transport system permease protein
MGFFISLSFLGLLGTTAPLTGLALVWVIPVVMGATMICTGVLNLAIDRLAYKPLRRAPRLAPLITASRTTQRCIGESATLAGLGRKVRAAMIP